MPIPTTEFARRALLRALAENSGVIRIVDNDADDSSPDPDQVRGPDGIMDMVLSDIGLVKQAEVEVLRADLKAELVLIDGELTMAKLSPKSRIGTIRDFIRAALDMKL
jgi:hypothetical protein